MTEKLLRMPAVIDITGLGKSTIYRLIAQETFPKPVKINGSLTIGFVESEIAAWVQSRIEQRDKKVKARA